MPTAEPPRSAVVRFCGLTVPTLSVAKLARLHRRAMVTMGAVAMAGLMVALPADWALADCLPTVPLSGATVTCTGTQNTTYTATDLSSLVVSANATNFNANPAFNFLRIGSLAITSTNSNLQSVNLTDIGNLNFTITGGNVNGGITLTGGGTATLTNSTNINGLVNFSGAQNTIDNSGTFNQGLVLSGTTGNSVTNRAGASINQTFSITGSGTNRVDNFGTINNGITLSGNGVNFITNAASATINQNVVSTGTANNTIDNSGLINNNITLGSGNDVVINRLGGNVNFNVDDPSKNVVNGVINMGDGANQFFMFGGTVNNQVLQGSGDDMATISGGTITQLVSTGGGQDQLLWTGGTIGALNMGSGNDLATLRGLTSANLGNIPIDGGLGTDRLILDNTSASGVTRFLNWEAIELTNGSQLTFNNNNTLALGDSGTGTGSLSIDATSTVFAGQGSHSIVSFTPGLLVTVNNAGMIDLTNGGSGPTDSLTVAGNYVGQSGKVALDTVLAGDGAPSDRLIISMGAATGTTSLTIKNASGLGNLTTGSGILVVDAINGATTAPGAFVLAAPVVAGPYEYMLFRGDGNPQAWYLRSTLSCSVVPSDPSCATPTPTPPDCAATPTDPGCVTSSQRPHYRQEVSLYAAIPSMALLYGRTLLDTLHERVGEEEHLRGGRDLGASATNNGQWGRAIYLNGNRDGDPLGIYGDGPKYDYRFSAFQAGQDIYRAMQPNGARNHLGVYGAIGGGRGDVTHFDGTAAGHDSFTAYTFGGYWTHFGPTGWYLDSVLQGSWYDSVKGASGRLPDLKTQGGGMATSLEAGYPIRLAGGWMIEPQAQGVYQVMGLDQGNDVAATVKFGNIQSLAGRLGVRFANTWKADGALMTAWLRPNIWYEFLGDPKTSFSSETGFIPFRADLGGSWAELNGGISAQVTRNTSLFANASYQIGLDGRSNAWDAKAGLRVNW